MKITLYGTCSFPFFYREVIRRAQERKLAVEWKVVLLSWRHVDLFKGVLPATDLFYVHEQVNQRMKEPMPDLSCLKNYPGSIYRDIHADKNAPGMLRRHNKEYQLKTAL